MQTPQPATTDAYVLSEGPFWDAARSRLLWVDIEAGLVLTGTLADNGTITETERIPCAGKVGAAAPATDGSLLIAIDGGLMHRAEDGTLTPGPTLVPAGSGRRLNDGRPDPAGRYLVGSLRMDGPSSTEELFLIDPDADQPIRVLDADLTLSNGLSWSPDQRTLFSVDTEARTIHRRDWDPATGRAGERSAYVRLTKGYPDGITIDADGHLWVAVWGEGCVHRYAPDARRVATLDLPVPYVSSVAFAGDDLGTLVITTSYRDLDDAGRTAHPHAGKVFTTRPGVSGVAQPLWSGRLPGSPQTSPIGTSRG